MRIEKIKEFHKIATRDSPIFEPFARYQDSGYDDFYPPLESEKIEYEESLENIYCGQRVCWIGNKGKMMKVDSNYIYAIHGNEFYQDKLDHLKNRILQGGLVYLYAPYGTMSIVDINDIIESLEYEGQGYEHNPLTTGDEELDHYLVNKEDYDEEEAEEMEDALSAAIEKKEGDIGRQIVQVRDGNHRAFAAIAAGEEYVWIKMSDNQHQDIEEGRPWASRYKEFLR